MKNHFLEDQEFILTLQDRLSEEEKEKLLWIAYQRSFHELNVSYLQDKAYNNALEDAQRILRGTNTLCISSIDKEDESSLKTVMKLYGKNMNEIDNLKVN